MKQIVIFNILASMAMATAALRAQTPAAATCSNATLSGTYGVSINGTRPAPSVLPNLTFGGLGAVLPGYIEQVIGLSRQTFDGQGSFLQSDNVKGSVSGITPNRPGSGTYSVNSDCTGTYTVIPKGGPSPIVVQFVIVNGGAEFQGVVVSPQAVMIIASGRKI